MQTKTEIKDLDPILALIIRPKALWPCFTLLFRYFTYLGVIAFLNIFIVIFP